MGIIAAMAMGIIAATVEESQAVLLRLQLPIIKLRGSCALWCGSCVLSIRRGPHQYQLYWQEGMRCLYLQSLELLAARLSSPCSRVICYSAGMGPALQLAFLPTLLLA